MNRQKRSGGKYGKTKNEPLTLYWQNGGFSAKLKVNAAKSATSQSRKTLAAF